MTSNISIAMTSCNGEKYIEVQIDSLLTQLTKPDEIIVCDDASTDSTLSILSRYEHDGLIKVYTNKERIGVIKNFKKAVGLCKHNNYIALCDQDDYWLPEKLKYNLAALRSLEGTGKPSLVYSDLMFVNDHLQVIEDSFWHILNIKPEKEDIKSLLFGNFITGCSIMMNKEMSDLLCNMPDDGATMHDAWLALIAFTFGSCKFIDQPLVLYRQHGGNITFQTNKSRTLESKFKQVWNQIFHNSNYLRNEITMAKIFYAIYNPYMEPYQQEIFENYIDLENSPFIKKKFFSFLSRAYRLTNNF